MLVLGVESTCDETAIALVEDGCRVVAETIASQVDDHAIYGGVVPEIASRAHIENLALMLHGTIEKAGIAWSDIDAVAVANRPGLVGCLMVGLTAAKTLAWTLDKPLIGVDHVQAHLYSVCLDARELPLLPAVGLVVSGGHTSLYHVRSWTDILLLGRTIDDAVGEAYDKVAALLKLGYPGGPVIDRLAEQGDAKAIAFPRPLLGPDSLDFSFSGLKTSVLYHVRGKSGRERDVESLTQPQIADVCASFQAACVEVIEKKLSRARRRTSAASIIVGGGVSANRGLRSALDAMAVPTFTPPMRYCTDNAAMTAGLGGLLLRQGFADDLTLDASPRTSLV
ncbi:MAG: tRNA (adenosine(37)-N6)-threonylcarbamoyltransferase complex transferase subunit TsaD [Planctomycetota bacterium]